MESWRKPGESYGLGSRFELVGEGCGFVGMHNGKLLVESMIISQKGGNFVIDTGNGKSMCSSLNSHVASPHKSGYLSFIHFPYHVYR